MLHPTATSIQVDDVLPARRSLRVAVVTETYPPEVNGVAATIARVVEGLHERGHQLQLMRPRQDEHDRPAGEDRFVEHLMRGLPIPRYPQLRMGLPARRELLRHWTTRRPDVVHVITEGPLGWSAVEAARHLRLPLVSDFRTNFHAYSRHYGMAWLRNPIMGYLRKFHNRTACTMVPTESLYAELKASGFRDLRVVARGVDVHLFNPARRSDELRRQWGAQPGDTVLLCVGRLAPEKNLPLLLEAFEALQHEDPAARLVFVGDGPERDALQSRCPAAVFAGTQRHEALAAHYASADVFVFPSLTETFGNVVPEAMASGLPVLGFDYAAAHQLVRHGENGLLAPFEDAAAFVATTRRLAGERPMLRAMGAAARLTALEQDWARIVDQVEGVYLEAMARPMTRERPAWRHALPLA